MKVRRFLSLHLSTLDPLEAQQIRIQLLNFKRRTDEFRSTAECWEDTKKSRAVLVYCVSFCPTVINTFPPIVLLILIINRLAELAIRVIRTLS